MSKDPAEGDSEKQRTSDWRARPVSARVVRVAMLLVPALAGALTLSILINVLPEPQGAGGVVTWVGLLLVGSIAPVLLLTRVMQLFAPLAFLLDLTLVFPDNAPSRFKVARSAVRLRGGDERDFHRAASGSEGAGQVLALIASLGSHDQRTRGHSERVRVFTEMLAEEMHIPAAERAKLRWSALLHDIGKLKVPAAILNKPGRPDEKEWNILHRHPTEGMRIALPLLALLGPWAGAIKHHHERYDGRGYPSGLAGGEIPYAARILAVSDAYEVMTAARPYKRPLSARAARAELVKSAGTQFDPAVVRSFLNISIGRLWRGIGFAALLAQLPLIGILFQRGIAQRVGREAASLSATGALVVSMATLGMMGSPAPTPALPSPVATDVVTPDGSDAPIVIPGSTSEQPPKTASNADQNSRGAAPSGAPDTRTGPSGDAAPRAQSEPHEGPERPEPPPRDPDPQPDPEEPPPDHFASGRISATTPASSVLGGATQSEFLLACGVPNTQGVDGWVFPLPEETSFGDATAGVSGSTDAPTGYNLDVFFYSAECASLGAFQGGAPDESGPLPAGTRYVVVNAPEGLDTQVALAVTH